jgi:hypothetical protein
VCLTNTLDRNVHGGSPFRTVELDIDIGAEAVDYK